MNSTNICCSVLVFDSTQGEEEIIREFKIGTFKHFQKLFELERKSKMNKMSDTPHGQTAKREVVKKVRVVCPFCQKDYNKMFDLMSHIRNKHDQEARTQNWVRCGPCGNFYPNPEKLSRHLAYSKKCSELPKISKEKSLITPRTSNQKQVKSGLNEKSIQSKVPKTFNDVLPTDTAAKEKKQVKVKNIGFAAKKKQILKNQILKFKSNKQQNSKSISNAVSSQKEMKKATDPMVDINTTGHKQNKNLNQNDNCSKNYKRLTKATSQRFTKNNRQRIKDSTNERKTFQNTSLTESVIVTSDNEPNQTNFDPLKFLSNDSKTPKSSCLDSSPTSEDQLNQSFKLKLSLKKIQGFWTIKSEQNLETAELEKKSLSYEKYSPLSDAEKITILNQGIRWVKKEIYTLKAEEVKQAKTIDLSKTDLKLGQLQTKDDDDNQNQREGPAETNGQLVAYENEMINPNKQFLDDQENFEKSKMNAKALRVSLTLNAKIERKIKKTKTVGKVALKTSAKKMSSLSEIKSPQIVTKKINSLNENKSMCDGASEKSKKNKLEEVVSTNNSTKTAQLSGLILQPKITQDEQQVILQPKIAYERFSQVLSKRNPVTSHGSFENERRDINISSVSQQTTSVTQRYELRKRNFSDLQQNNDDFEGNMSKRLCMTNDVTTVDSDDSEMDSDDDNIFEVIDINSDDDDDDYIDIIPFCNSLNDQRVEVNGNDFRLKNGVKSEKASEEEGNTFFSVGADKPNLKRLELTERPEYFPPEGPYMCEMCEIFVKTNREFVNHIKSSHAQDIDEEVLEIMESHLKVHSVW